MTLVFDEKDHDHDNEGEKDNPFAKIRIQKILEYAERQKKRIAAEKENDFEQIDEFQQEWVEHKHRIKGSARSWETWDSHLVREEWEPWDRFGRSVNRWRYYKLQ